MSGAREKSEDDKKVDAAVDSIDIITAYNLWAGKGTADARGRTESIKVRCPNPSHPDRDPSAWINTDKGTWFCGSCEEGGDKFDIAAWHFGLPVPGYKDGKNFHELRRKIAESQGYVFTPSITGGVRVVAPVEQGDDGEPPVPPVAVDEAHTSTPVTPPDPKVTELPTGPIAHAAERDIELEWRKIIPKGTFLDVWMKQTTIDDVPEEYHFWNGMLALAAAAGRDVSLDDFRPVYSNLFICFLGRTGSGKSRAKYYLDQLLEEALPYKHSDPFSKGILRVNAPASAEALIYMFKKELEDPSAPKTFISYPVKGMIDFNELSSLVGRANRAGSVIVPTLMQFYDMETTVETVSRTHGSEKATEPFACAITTSQPKSLRGLLTISDAASGFLNRWFFAAGKHKPRWAIGAAPVDIKPAIKPLQDILGWAGTAGKLEWSQEAKDDFTLFFQTKLEPLMRNDDTNLLNRMDLLCKKLVLLFSINMRTKRVEPEAVAQMKKMYPYLLECYDVPGATIGDTMQNEIREWILKVIIEFQEKTGRGASNRDIQQRIKHRKYPLDIYNRVLKNMLEIEEIELRSTAASAKGGRPTNRYYVPDLEEMVEYLRTKTEGKATSEKKASEA